MTDNHDKKVIYLKGDKTKELVINKDSNVMITNDGDVIHLESFVLSGIDTDDNQVVLISNSSVEESIVYKEILNATIQKNLFEKMDRG